jgi:hypothetical protein
MGRVAQPLRRERVVDAIDCQTEMIRLKLDIGATMNASHRTITASLKLLAEVDDLLSRQL